MPEKDIYILLPNLKGEISQKAERELGIAFRTIYNNILEIYKALGIETKQLSNVSPSATEVRKEEKIEVRNKQTENLISLLGPYAVPILGSTDDDTLTEGLPATPASAIDHNSLLNLTVGDPHTQYQKESEKGAASGYASLDATTRVPQAELGTGGTGGTTKFLREDRTWQVPPAGAGGGNTILDYLNL